jgi:serine/threonine protein phosphatase PrpC
MKLAPISTDNDDIYMSIGFNKSRNKAAAVAVDGPIAEEADGDNGDLMATKWGAGLFEMVEDDLDSDDDDDSMSYSAGAAATATKNTPVEQSTATSTGADMEHSEMPAEEEELRANRFKKSNATKQRRSHESINTGSVTADNTDAQASSSSLHAKMEKGRVMKKDNDDEEDEEDEGLEASTTNLTMSEFGAMMDTLALQPRSKNMSAAVPLTLEIKPESFSVQLRNFKNGVGAAFHSEQGQRADQEDRCVLLPDVGAMRALQGNEKVTDATREALSKFSIAAVFDGHSGWQCSQYLSQHLIPAMALHPKFLENKIEPAILDTFRNMDAKINNILRKEECTAGSTGIVAVYDGRKHVLTVANVGDSMCVLSRSGRAVKLHRVHRVFDSPDYEEERKRVEATGSRIVNHRVDGVLAISRAFGDIALKGNPKAPGPVIAIPDIVAEVITPMTEFGIIASDGLWDVMEPQLSVNYLQEAAAELAREALARGSLDNVTILILSFHMPYLKEETEKKEEKG